MVVARIYMLRDRLIKKKNYYGNNLCGVGGVSLVPRLYKTMLSLYDGDGYSWSKFAVIDNQSRYGQN